MLRAATVLAALALLAGCGGGDGDGAGGQQGGARLGGPITFEVIGGDAFRDDAITVEPDGTALVRTRAGEATAELTAGERSELAAQAEALAGARTALTEPPRPDALSYRFTYRSRQVETDSGALPDELAPLIGTFIELIDRHGPA
jgi:hypothetical protein